MEPLLQQKCNNYIPYLKSVCVCNFRKPAFNKCAKIFSETRSNYLINGVIFLGGNFLKITCVVCFSLQHLYEIFLILR